jgi:parafibromin
MNEASPFQTQRKPPKEHTPFSYLESDLASLFLRRRKTNRSYDSTPISPISPSGGARDRERSGGYSNKSNIDGNTSSLASSSVSQTSKHRPNVSDWNEKVVRESMSTNESQNSYAADPPRPPKHGFEWVWFPQGYWAEREILGHTPKNRKSHHWWFSRSSGSRKDSTGSSGSKSKAPSTKTPTTTISPPTKLGGSRSKSQDSSLPQGPNNVEGQAISSDSRSGSKRLVRGLQLMSPISPRRTSPSGERKGLPDKTRKGFELYFPTKKKKMVITSGSLTIVQS